MHSSFPYSSKDQARLGFTARYVPTSVEMFPNTNTVTEYGTTLNLDNYGVVVVSGEDKSGCNKIVAESNRGYSFALDKERETVLES